MIELKEISKAYHGSHVLDGLFFTVHKEDK